MDEAVFKNQLNDLVKEISDVPAPQRDKLIMLAKQTRASHKRLRDKISALQESLDYLRVSIKYLLFDLEATRRENTHYKKILEDRDKDKK